MSGNHAPGFRAVAILLRNHRAQLSAFERGDFAQAATLADAAASYIEATREAAVISSRRRAERAAKAEPA